MRRAGPARSAGFAPRRLPILIGLRVVMSRSARARSFLFALVGALVGALAVMCCLAPISGLLVRQREAARAGGLEPEAVSLEPVRRGSPANLAATVNRPQYRGGTVLLVRVAAGQRTGLPAGLPAAPAAGQAVVSPRLADLIDEDPLLRRWFPEIVGELPRQGVGSAGELRAYVGVAAAQLGGGDMPPSLGFGQLAERKNGFGWYESAGFVLFLVVPGLGLLVTASRFGRRTRQERHRALRLAGMSSAGARVAAATEMSAPALVGGLLSVVAALVALPARFVLPIADRTVFGADAVVPPALAAMVVATVTTLAAGLGANSASGHAARRRVRRILIAGRGDGASLGWVFLAGLAATGTAFLRVQPRDPLLWVGIALLGVGLPGATAAAARTLAGALGRPGSGVTRLLAMRRIEHDALSVARVAGTVGIAAFVVMASRPITQAIATPNLPGRHRPLRG